MRVYWVRETWGQESQGVLVSVYGGWDVGMGESVSRMKSFGRFVDRGLKRGGFIVGMKTVEHCPCSASTYEAFVRHFLFD